MSRKIGSLISLLIFLAIAAAVWYGLFHAMLNWPVTIFWGLLLVMWSFGLIFGGLRVAIQTIGDAW